MMKRKMRDEWVAKLRSGEYEQGTLYLCHNGKYCCLGVLCDMQETGREFDGGSKEWPILPGGIDAKLSMPPTRLSAGLSVGDRETLANMNDSGKTFTEIADWIEKNVGVED